MCDSKDVGGFTFNQYFADAMSIRKTIPDNDGVYFITFTCKNWLPLFSACNAYNVVYKWFDYLKADGHYIISYVIMPNHIHAVIAFGNTGKSINSIIGNGKRFMAYRLISILKEQNKTAILKELQSAVTASETKAQKLHSVFEKSFEWKECGSEKFMDQKLAYIHNNPGKAGLVTLAEDYLHSSAKFYLTGKHSEYEVTNFMELNDIDLTNGKR